MLWKDRRWRMGEVFRSRRFRLGAKSFPPQADQPLPFDLSLLLPSSNRSMQPMETEGCDNGR